MKRSKSVSRKYVIFGTSFIATCFSFGCTPAQPELVHNKYNSLEDCLKDYSKEQCSPDDNKVNQAQNSVSPVIGHNGVLTYYYGPYYRSAYLGSSLSSVPEADRASVGRTFAQSTTGVSSAASSVATASGEASSPSEAVSSVRSAGAVSRSASVSRAGFGASAAESSGS
jgi:hypothetical protein